MKIRKILPLALLAVGALFMLTSCDAMLDALFPANSLTVYVHVPASYYTDYATATMKVDVTSTTGTVYVAGPVTELATDSDGYVNYSFSFPKLSNGDYNIVATYDGPYYYAVQPQFTPDSINYQSTIHLPPSGTSTTRSLAVDVYF
jgi:hypothetical protein